MVSKLPTTNPHIHRWKRVTHYRTTGLVPTQFANFLTPPLEENSHLGYPVNAKPHGPLYPGSGCHPAVFGQAHTEEALAERFRLPQPVIIRVIITIEKSLDVSSKPGRTHNF